MSKNNSKSMLASMMAGVPTRESEALRLRTTGDKKIDPRIAEQIINESALPSASEMSFQQVAKPNGTTGMVVAGSQTGYDSVSADAIKAMISGVKSSQIKEEMSIRSTSSPEAERELKPLDMREEMKKRMAKLSGQQTLSEAVMPQTSHITKSSPMQFDSTMIDMVENLVFDILGDIVGHVNKDLTDKKIIKEKIEESVLFLKLTKAISSSKK